VPHQIRFKIACNRFCEVNLKKKVLHILTRFIQGGADENTLHTLHGLDKQKYEIDFLVGGESDRNFLQQVNGSARVFVIQNLMRNLNPWNDLVAFWRIYQRIALGKYDLVHTHTAKAGILGRAAAALAGTPIIVHGLHGVTFHDHQHPLLRSFYILLERLTASFTDSFVTVGEDLKQKYLHERIGRANRFTTIRSGFDLDLFQAASERQQDEIQRERRRLDFGHDDIVLGTISRLEPRKGLTYLLKAAKRVIEQVPNAKFMIVGEGYHRKALEYEAEQLGLNGGVRFVGYRTDVPVVLRCMDVFVFTSLWEGLPRVLAQAAAIGKPIVSFDVDGAAEIVTHGENGYLVPSKDVDSLTSSLLICARDLTKARQMGLHGRAQVDRAWHYKVMIEEINDLYRQLFKQSSNAD